MPFRPEQISCIHKDEFKRSHHMRKPPTTEEWNSIPPIPEDKKRSIENASSLPRSFNWCDVFFALPMR